MKRHKLIVGLACTAAIVVMLSFMVMKFDVGYTVGGKATRVGNEDASRRGLSGDSVEDRNDSERQAVRELLAAFEDHIVRLMAGDDTLTNADRMDMEYKLQLAIQHSPALRAALKNRLRDAFRRQEITALMELERAFSVSDIGVVELMGLYHEEAKRGGPLDFYALQNASYFPKAMDGDMREALFQSAFSQMRKYDEHSKYNGAMLFFSSMARSGLPIPEVHRRMAISMMEGKLKSVSKGEDQYFAAQNLYKMLSAEDSASKAITILDRLPTYPVAQATLEAIVHGRMAVDGTLIQKLVGLATRGDLTQQESLKLQELLARVPRGSINGS